MDTKSVPALDAAAAPHPARATAITALGGPLLEALGRTGCGALLMDRAGHCVLLNPLAAQILECETGVAALPGTETVRAALGKLLRRGQGRFSLDADAWVLIPRPDKRDLVLHAVPLGVELDPHTLLLLIDLHTAPKPNPEALQKMFDLTAAEARLALQLLDGGAPADIARRHGVSIATVRSQLASVFSKTRTGRQAELVALLARLSVLP